MAEVWETGASTQLSIEHGATCDSNPWPWPPEASSFNLSTLNLETSQSLEGSLVASRQTSGALSMGERPGGEKLIELLLARQLDPDNSVLREELTVWIASKGF